MTILDSRLPQLGKDAADKQAMDKQTQNHRSDNQQAHAGDNGAQLVRDPMARLEALFDAGSVQLLLPADTGGMLAAEGVDRRHAGRGVRQRSAGTGRSAGQRGMRGGGRRV